MSELFLYFYFRAISAESRAEFIPFSRARRFSDAQIARQSAG